MASRRSITTPCGRKALLLTLQDRNSLPCQTSADLGPLPDRARIISSAKLVQSENAQLTSADAAPGSWSPQKRCRKASGQIMISLSLISWPLLLAISKVHNYGPCFTTRLPLAVDFEISKFLAWARQAAPTMEALWSIDVWVPRKSWDISNCNSLGISVTRLLSCLVVMSQREPQDILSIPKPSDPPMSGFHKIKFNLQLFA